MAGSNCVNSDPFVEISDEQCLLTLQSVLRQRLPISSHECNILISKDRFRDYPGYIRAFTLDGDLGSNAIIVLIIYREDFGRDISISVPLDYVTTTHLRDSLINTNIIDWTAAYMFTSLSRLISPLIVEISTIVKKNSSLVNPNCHFLIDPNEALQQKFCLGENVELGPLHPVQGTKFLLDNWKYTREGSAEHVIKVIEKNPTSGVYVDGQIVCGAVANANGTLGMLHTDNNFRRAGYAQLCMRFLLKEMAQAGLIPVSSARATNARSCRLHDKLGMNCTHETDYIINMSNAEERVSDH